MGEYLSYLNVAVLRWQTSCMHEIWFAACLKASLWLYNKLVTNSRNPDSEPLPTPGVRTLQRQCQERAISQAPFDSQQREINSHKVGSLEQEPNSSAFQEWFVDSEETVLGFCFELPGRRARLPLLLTKAPQYIAKPCWWWGRNEFYGLLCVNSF